MLDEEGAAALDELVRQCRAREESGYAGIYRLLSRPLFGVALRMLGRPEEAEEALQETFLSYWRSVDSVPAGMLRPWMHRVLANHCIDRLRRARRWQETSLDEATTPGAPRSEAARFDLDSAVCSLPHGARIVFLLHDVEGFNHREIAGILGLAEGTTKSQLFRARAMLRARLAKSPRGGSAIPASRETR